MTTTPSPVLAATLLHGGRRHVLGAEGIAIGRDAANGVCLEGRQVSRHHARVHPDGSGGWVVSDLGSANGTLLNGERFRDATRSLQTGDHIVVGGETLHFLAGQDTRMGGPAGPERPAQVVPVAGDRLRIGRDAANDLVLDDPNVSRLHAEVVREGGRMRLRDKHSRNGTRVDGRLVAEADLVPGSEVGIGPYRLVFDGTTFIARDDRGALRLDAEDLTVKVRGKTILDRASLSVEPGMLVAIIGESGAGKSTLLRALGGVSTPTSGSVAVNGEPVAARRTDVGYVPQDEIVHAGLTVREALRYAARLRLPADADRADVEAAVDRVLGELALEQHADTRIGSLSGGQRKRAGVATELLGRPSLLFLDEPTTGLDPSLEGRMMRLLRELANEARAVVVVTHATKSLQLCDRLVVMGRGGHLCFAGPPADALAFFEVDDVDDVYDALDRVPATEWRARFDAARDRPMPADETPTTPAGAGAGAGAGVGTRRREPRRATSAGAAAVLAERSIRLLLRDRRNFALLLAQAPVLGILIGLLFDADTFDRTQRHVANAAQLLFFLVITVIWLGSIAAAREIIRERAVLSRERAIGVGTGAYLLAKTAVLGVVSLLQTALLLVVVLGLRPLDEPASSYAAVALLLALTGIAAVAMGLVVSAAVRSQEQATSLIPLVLIPQLLFGGAVVPVKEMSDLIAGLSKLVFGQWAFAGLGTAVHMNERFAGRGPYGTDFFDIATGPVAIVLACFAAVMLAVVAVLLERRPDA
jgi:ABC transport system ATP-binding/permease protein